MSKMAGRSRRSPGSNSMGSSSPKPTRKVSYDDPNFPDRKQGRQAAERATALDTSARLKTRFALQNILLECMQEQRLDALVSPMSTVLPRKLTAPREPAVNGRPPIGWSLIGQQGFPAITVPAGFTTQIWDRAPDSNAARAWPAPHRLTCPWAWISLRVRSMKPCYSASPRPSRQPPGIAGHRRTLDPCPVNRNEENSSQPLSSSCAALAFDFRLDRLGARWVLSGKTGVRYGHCGRL